MEKKEIEEAIKEFREWQIRQDEREKFRIWIKVRCMAIGSAIAGGMWTCGSWAAQNVEPIAVALKAFFSARNGQ